jgi:hypothetical protein
MHTNVHTYIHMKQHTYITTHERTYIHTYIHKHDVNAGGGGQERTCVFAHPLLFWFANVLLTCC